MAKKIDKTRSEQEGTVAFIGTGVGIETPVTQEDDDLTEKIRAIVAEMLSNLSTEGEEVVGETVQNINTLILTKNEEILNEITEIWNSINNFSGALNVVCYAYMYSALTNIDSGVQVTVELDRTLYDPLGMLNVSTHRVIIPQDGRYLVTFCVAFFNTVEATYQAAVQSNAIAGTIFDSRWNPGGDDATPRATFLLDLTAGDYLELVGFMSSIDPDNQVDIYGGEWPYYSYLLVTKIN